MPAALAALLTAATAPPVHLSPNPRHGRHFLRPLPSSPRKASRRWSRDRRLPLWEQRDRRGANPAGPRRDGQVKDVRRAGGKMQLGLGELMALSADLGCRRTSRRLCLLPLRTTRSRRTCEASTSTRCARRQGVPISDNVGVATRAMRRRRLWWVEHPDYSGKELMESVCAAHGRYVHSWLPILCDQDLQGSSASRRS